ncbi:hypothetical protein P7C70_g9267, partial [Phenoliferia sp. Uapishka_3]
MSALEVGQQFNTMDEAKSAFAIAAAADGMDLRTPTRNKIRMNLVCRFKDETDCPFSATVRKQAGDTFKIVSLVSEHRCHGFGGDQKRAITQSTKFTLEFMNVTPQTLPEQIRAEFKRHGIDLPYKAAWRAKVEICGESITKQALQFSQFPDYLSRILESDPEATCKFRLHPQTGAFQGVFISPSAARTAWCNSHRFLAVDGAFTKTTFEYVLLLAAGYDPNNELVLFAWAEVLKESEGTWSWFFELLEEHLSGVNSPRTTIMSDWQKVLIFPFVSFEEGLLAAIKQVLPNAVEGFCCVHLLRNFKSRKDVGAKSPDAKALFWTCANAQSGAEFNAGLSAVSKRFGRPAADYLDDIPHDKWVYCEFPGPRYGRASSNIVEIANSLFEKARGLPPLDLLAAIYEYEMEQWAERRREAEASQEKFPSAATVIFVEQVNLARSYLVTLSTNTRPSWSGLVKHPLSQTDAKNMTTCAGASARSILSISHGPRP